MELKCEVPLRFQLCISQKGLTATCRCDIIIMKFSVSSCVLATKGLITMCRCDQTIKINVQCEAVNKGVNSCVVQQGKDRVKCVVLATKGLIAMCRCNNGGRVELNMCGLSVHCLSCVVLYVGAAEKECQWKLQKLLQCVYSRSSFPSSGRDVSAVKWQSVLKGRNYLCVCAPSMCTQCVTTVFIMQLLHLNFTTFESK